MGKLIRIPQILEDFFQPLRKHFNKRSFAHFKILCAMMATSCENKTIRQISSLIAFGPHRSNHNDFVLSSPWDEEALLKDAANHRLERLAKKGEPVFAVIDDSKKKKSGKTVQGIGKIFDPVSKAYIQGHQMVTLTLYYRGQTIPYGIKLYLKKSVAQKLEKPFFKLSQLAQQLLESIDLPFEAKVYVLTDSFYANKTVIHSAVACGFVYIGALKENRTFIIGGRKTNVRSYAKNAFNRKRKSRLSIKTNRGSTHYRFLSTVATVSKIGQCRLTFSKKGSRKKILALVCTDVNMDPRSIISFYCFRWSIEVWFKQLKQHLGFGALHRRMLSGVIKHLHLSACAYLLLTHLPLVSEKGKKYIPVAVSITSLQNCLKSILMQDMFDAFIEKFALQPWEASPIRKMKETLFDETKLYKLAA